MACTAPLAAQTLVHQWRFGEADSGAIAGGGVTTALDSVGSIDLTASGTINYTSATAGASSTLAASFGAAASFTGTVDTSLAPNSSFVIEGWFYFAGTPANTTNLLFYNGDPNTTGIGLYVKGTALQVLEGGHHDYLAGSITANQWNYVALVYANGAFETFVNSDTTPSYSQIDGFSNYPGGTNKFWVGGGFDGSIDELRVSTFSGSFSTSMLSYSAISAVPEPSTYAMLAGLATLGFVAWRRRAQVAAPVAH